MGGLNARHQFFLTWLAVPQNLRKIVNAICLSSEAQFSAYAVFFDNREAEALMVLASSWLNYWKHKRIFYLSFSDFFYVPSFPFLVFLQ